jgi:hypothetical protein
MEENLALRLLRPSGRGTTRRESCAGGEIPFKWI